MSGVLFPTLTADVIVERMRLGRRRRIAQRVVMAAYISECARRANAKKHFPQMTDGTASNLEETREVAETPKAQGNFQQGSSVVEHAAHNHDVAGSTPAPAPNSPVPAASGLLVEAGPAQGASCSLRTANLGEAI